MLTVVKRQLKATLPAPLLRRYRNWIMQRKANPEPELSYCRRWVTRNDMAIDVGASGGLYTDMLSASCWRVIAVEPNPSVAEGLRRLRLKNVDVIEAAASDCFGTVTLRVPMRYGSEDTGLGTIAEKNALPFPDVDSIAAHSIKTITLDSLLGRLPRRIAFIKIDVEGHEQSVIDGAKELIAKHRPVIQSETEERVGADVPAFFEAMRQLRYSSHALVEGSLVPIDASKMLASQQPGATNRINNVIFQPLSR